MKSCTKSAVGRDAGQCRFFFINKIREGENPPEVTEADLKKVKIDVEAP